MNRLLVCFSAGALALAGTVAGAATTAYGGRASLEAALGTTVIDDYSNSGYVGAQNNAGMSAVLGETDYEPTGHPDNNLVPDILGNNLYCAG